MDPWHFEPAPDLDKTLTERLRNFPRQPDMLIYGARSAAALAMRGWLRVYHRLKIEGRENLPPDQSFVLVANHASHLDVMCLLAALPMRKLHRVFPAAARDYFFVSVPRTILAAVVVNALPFERRMYSGQSLALCSRLLENPGNVLIIFPEGTRSTTGELGEFKPGIGLVAAGKEYPVIPCYLHGAHEAWPKGSFFPRPRRLQLTIGTPRRFSEFEPGKASARQICSELRKDVLALRERGCF
jgi:1-acyl-sn-glycerol-3-phosphate acyltransferase